MSTLEEIKSEFVRIYEEIFRRRGLPPIFGRIFAVFHLEGRELSQQDISDLTGYSISSVSRALDQMTQMGMLYKHKDTRSLRQFVYRMNLDIGEMVTGTMEILIKNTARSVEEFKNLDRKINALKLEVKEQVEVNRIQIVLKNHEKHMESLLDIVKDIMDKLHGNKVSKNTHN